MKNLQVSNKLTLHSDDFKTYYEVEVNKAQLAEHTVFELITKIDELFATGRHEDIHFYIQFTTSGLKGIIGRLEESDLSGDVYVLAESRIDLNDMNDYERVYINRIVRNTMNIVKMMEFTCYAVATNGIDSEDSLKTEICLQYNRMMANEDIY